MFAALRGTLQEGGKEGKITLAVNHTINQEAVFIPIRYMTISSTLSISSLRAEMPSESQLSYCLAD